jgi:hypothetical protein
MTVERKIVVGLDDIQALTLECIKCTARLTVSPDGISGVPRQCNRCNADWLIPNDTAVVSEPFTLFATSLGKIRELLKTYKKEKLGFRILLEFKEPLQ